MAVKPKQAPPKASSAAAAKKLKADTAVAAKNATCVFRVAQSKRRSIWREIEVRPEHSLYQLAEAIMLAFGFDFDHAFGFYPEAGPRMYRANPRYELFTDLGEPTDEHALGVKKVSVATVFPEVGKRMALLFDYGDEWWFVVELTGIGQTEPDIRYPRLLRQRGEAPVQYPEPDDDE
jgi:hypothetical protein